MRVLRVPITVAVTAALLLGFSTTGNALDSDAPGDPSTEQSVENQPESEDGSLDPTDTEEATPETAEPEPEQDQADVEDGDVSPENIADETDAPEPSALTADADDQRVPKAAPRGLSQKQASPSKDEVNLEEVAAASAASWCVGSEAWMRPGCVYKGVFADPTILPVVESGKTVYYAFGTTTSNYRLPVLRSTDLKTWLPTQYSSSPGWQQSWYRGYNPRTDSKIPWQIRQHRYANAAPGSFEEAREMWFNNDALVEGRPSWAVSTGFDPRGWIDQENWAPGVAKIGNKYFAYMSVRTRYPGQAGGAADGSFCIAVATSSKPGGPYTYANGGAPVQCQPSDPGGAIDPEPFNYNGKWYLIWKGQGRAGVTQGLYAQPINTNTGGLTGGAVQLLARDMSPGTWEVDTIESPSMATISGTTYLTYSAGNYQPGPGNTSNYATGYAVCPSGPTAPCYRPAGNLLMWSHDKISGPGGGSFFKAADGATGFAYHAYHLGGVQGKRTLRLIWAHKWPNGRLTFTTDRNPVFADVPNNHKFNASIRWLADRGITTGDRAGNFVPKGNVSRAAMAAFLYRYKGGKGYKPTGPEPFADVNKKTKFYKEIRWMHANGLSTGSKNPRGGKPLYKPQDSISRQAMAAFLYRLSGTKGYKPSGREPLFDVTPRSKFYKEIRWLYSTKITTGTKVPGQGVRFDQWAPTSREAFAAFLQRYDRKFGK